MSDAPQPVSELLHALCSRPWSVEIPVGPGGLAALVEFIDDGLVPVLFPDTRGGTELDVPLDRLETRLEHANFERGLGTVRLSGQLVLDDVPVRVIADIELATLTGTGQLYMAAATDGVKP